MHHLDSVCVNVHTYACVFLYIYVCTCLTFMFMRLTFAVSMFKVPEVMYI